MFSVTMGDAPLGARAWAAGLFDAEGCTNVRIERSGQRRLRISVPQSGHGRVPEVLTRFQSVVEAGVVYGPFPNGSHVWELRGAAIIPVMTLIWPWLGAVKRSQFDERLESYNGAPKTARAKTLPFVAPDLSAEAISSVGLAWAAGLFDGDGST